MKKILGGILFIFSTMQGDDSQNLEKMKNAKHMEKIKFLRENYPNAFTDWCLHNANSKIPFDESNKPIFVAIGLINEQNQSIKQVKSPHSKL